MSRRIVKLYLLVVELGSLLISINEYCYIRLICIGRAGFMFRCVENRHGRELVRMAVDLAHDRLARSEYE